MHVWMAIYKGASGKWYLSSDYPVRAHTRKAAEESLASRLKSAGRGGKDDDTYKLVRFVGKMPK